MHGFEFSEDDVAAILGATLVSAMAFLAYSSDFSPLNLLVVLLSAVLAVGAREVGQRTVAYLMDAYVDSVLSWRGSFISLVVASLSFLISSSVALIIPVYSEFEQKDYEQWGKSIDVIWSKRTYWLGGSGVLSVLAVWLPCYISGFETVSASLGVFALSQMLPLNETEFFQGRTDGAYVLLQSGYVWLLLTAFSIAAAVLPLL